MVVLIATAAVGFAQSAHARTWVGYEEENYTDCAQIIKTRTYYFNSYTAAKDYYDSQVRNAKPCSQRDAHKYASEVSRMTKFGDSYGHEFKGKETNSFVIIAYADRFWEIILIYNEVIFATWVYEY